MRLFEYKFSCIYLIVLRINSNIAVKKIQLYLKQFVRFCGVTVSSKGQVAVQSGYKSEALRTWPHWGRCTIPGYKSEAVRTWPPCGRCTLPGYKSEAVRTWPQWGRCTIPDYKKRLLRREGVLYLAIKMRL